MKSALFLAAAATGLAVFASTSFAAPALPHGECEHTRELELTVDASASDLLDLRAGSGSLRVEGRSDLSEVRIAAVACASDEDFLDDLRVEAERRGSSVVVETHYPDRDDDSWRWGRDEYARLDLTLEVPEGMAADIDDGSGEIVLVAVGDLRLDDGSGGIEIRDARGSVEVRDGSGEVIVDGAAGDVEVDDGSGSLDVREVRGSVTLTDGSGGIRVAGVTNDVRIRRDGSGSITVRRVGGDFVVDRDGSGSIRFDDVDGEVDLPRRRGRRGRRGGG